MKQVWNGYETGLSTGKKKNAILTFYVKEPGGVPANIPEKKSNKHRITAKKSWENTDIAI